MQSYDEAGNVRPDGRLAEILSTSAELFAEKGYHNASMRDISSATSISLAGLYHYFSGKEELLFRIQDTVMSDLLVAIEAGLEGVEDPQKRVEILMETHLTFFLQNMPSMKVLSHEARALDTERAAVVNAKKQRLTELTTGLLEDIRPNGVANVQPEIATLTLFGMLNWTYTWYTPEGSANPSELAGQMSSIFLRGYAGPTPTGGAKLTH